MLEVYLTALYVMRDETKLKCLEGIKKVEIWSRHQA